MKTRQALAIGLFLIVTSAVFSQTPRPASLAARTWQPFWRQFTVAVNKGDREALKNMMPEDFFDGGGGMTAGEWLQFIEENRRKGSWRDLRRSFAQGTRMNKEWSASGTPTRVTKDNGYYFEFRDGNRWYFAGVVGD